MALRAVKHKFTGITTPITSYDATKTNLGSLMVQKTGPNPADNFVGPLPVAVARPMQEVVETVGTVSVATTNVTGNTTNFTATMVGMQIGFGSNDPAKITTWYNIATRVAATGANCITIGVSAGTIVAGTLYVVASNIPMMYPHAITVSPTIDWVFLIENLATAVAPRRIFLYEYNKTTAVYAWKGFIIATLTTATAHTLRGFRALRYLHTNGTASTNNSTAVVGTNTAWTSDRLAAGARIGFGSNDPTLISTWYVISTVNNDGSMTLSTSAGVNPDGPYVIEELRFAITATNATAANGGLHVVKGVNYSDFTLNGATTIPAATNVDNIKAVYRLADMATVTNISATGCAIKPEINKGLHYAYVMDGISPASTPYAMKVYRYNLRATGTVASGKITLSPSYTTAGTVTVSDSPATGSVVGSGTSFTLAMVGMQIGFGATSPALIATWYTIASFTDGSHITLTTSAGTIGSASAYIIDSANVISTANEMITGSGVANVAALNNGRIGTLHHGPGANVESLYFVTANRIYRAPVAKIYAGSLEWVSENRPEVPPGGINGYPATATLSAIEIADSMDRLIVLSNGATAFRNYVTRYPQAAGDPFDEIWGVDDKQQDQILAGGGAYISSGTVQVATLAVTGTNTFFTAAMVGYKIGFGSTNPLSISTWYTIATFTDITHITLTTTAGNQGPGLAYVIDWNSNTYPHFNTASQIMSVWSENGIAHIIKHGVTPALCQMYALPLSAHWTFAATTGQRVITPALYTFDCAEFFRVIVTDDDRVGSGEFAITPEPFRLYFRLKGIDNNTGDWTLVGKDGDLSGLSGAGRIQFMLEFVTIGWFCVPARIMSLTVVYDDAITTTDSHYQPSPGMSNPASLQFVWRFAAPFDGAVPTLRVRLYDAVTGTLLLSDNSATPTGTWERTTNGGTGWATYGNDPTDKTNETTYLRYTPASLGDNIKVRAILTQ